MYKLYFCIVCFIGNVCMIGVWSRGIGYFVNVNVVSFGNLGSIILVGFYSCILRCLIKVIIC